MQLIPVSDTRPELPPAPVANREDAPPTELPGTVAGSAGALAQTQVMAQQPTRSERAASSPEGLLRRRVESERGQLLVEIEAARAETDVARSETDAARSQTVTAWSQTSTARSETIVARSETAAARSAADAANRSKAAFLATVSHELRTPLNAIGGYAELLELGLHGPVTEQQRVDLGRIRSSQQHLLRLINQVLDLVKVDAGEVRVDHSTLTAGETIDAALALVRPQAAAKELVLREVGVGAADLPYLGDEGRVRQVLVNLLANAVKFTPAGGRISIGCTVTDAPPANTVLAAGVPYVAFTIGDSGVGIATVELERIFEPFGQVEGSLTRLQGGTGLGLTISRHLARLMNGDLTVESRTGAGSTFTLWLPTPERRATPRGIPSIDDPGATRAGLPDGELSRALDGPTFAAAAAPASADYDVVLDAAIVTRISAGLLEEVAHVVRDWVAVMRTDGTVALAPGLVDRLVEDHAATFVTDIALALGVVAEAGLEPELMLRDGAAILNVIAQRHGAQRARLSWTEAAVIREFVLLGDTMDIVVARSTGADAIQAVARARHVIAQLLAQATRVSLASHRLTVAGGA